MTTQRVHQIGSIVLFIAGILLVRGSIDLHYYTSMGPGPGFFPFWLALILVILSVLNWVQVTFGERARELARSKADFAEGGDGFFRFVMIPIALAGTGFFLERVGFGITMFVMIAVVLWALGVRNILVMLIISTLGSFGVEYVFTHWLNVPLPPDDLAAICPSWLCGA
jgi:putative tricarboxylic transport membrane protein